MYEVDPLDDDVYRLSLTPAESWPDPIARPVNVYYIDGDFPALINAGHPTQYEQLAGALREAGGEPADIERIIHTSWRIDVLGGAKNFPGVDHFVFSPDMVEPHQYAAHIEQRRRGIREVAEELLESADLDSYNLQEIDRFLERYYPQVPREFSFIPCRSGQILRAGSFRLEVLGSPGVDPGHLSLYDREREILFSGDIALKGLPDTLVDVRSYLVSLERLIELDIDRLYPNRGRVRKRGRRVLKSSLEFVNNFMSNAPSAMYSAPTILEFVERNLGYRPEDFVELVLRVRLYGALMDELARSQMIETEGSGLERRYGTDVDDPREQIRPW